MTNENMKKLAGRLLESRTALVNSLPFFSRLLMHLKIGVSDCKTAYTDMENVVFDPDFAARISDDELQFVFLHEVLHCVLNHCIRGKGLNHTIYNIACDIVVNSIALDVLGLTSLTVDGCEVMHLALDGQEGRNYTAEDIYETLFHATQNQLNSFCKMNGLIPDGAGDSNNNNDDGNGGEGNDGDAQGKPSKGGKSPGSYGLFEALDNACGIDSHDEWDKIENSGLLKDQWNNAIKEASRSCGNGSGIPEELKRYFKDIVKSSEVNWHQVLHDFIKHSRSDYTYSTPDRRFDGDIIMPSFQENIYGCAVSNLWFLIDTSGSVSDYAISEVYGEILNCISLMDSMEGKLSFFDTEVSDPIDFTDEDELLAIKPVGSGGTSFYSIFNYLRKEIDPEELPEAIIILTDGYAPFPPEGAAMNIPVIWIISDSDVEPPWGTTVSIN